MIFWGWALCWAVYEDLKTVTEMVETEAAHMRSQNRKPSEIEGPRVLILEGELKSPERRGLD